MAMNYCREKCVRSDESRSSGRKAGIKPDKVDVLLDFTRDISRDGDRKDEAPARKRLEKMEKILSTLS